jgi:hypothetical protein
VGKTKRGKGTKLRVLAAGKGTPLGIGVAKASPSAVKLLERAREAVKVTKRRGPRRRPQKPQRLIADRGYDSNGARALVGKRASEPLLPKRKNPHVATPHDGRKLRRYRRRWIIERPNSWRQNFRRLAVRYEPRVKPFEARVPRACALVTLKKVSGCLLTLSVLRRYWPGLDVV